MPKKMIGRSRDSALLCMGVLLLTMPTLSDAAFTLPNNLSFLATSSKLSRDASTERQYLE
jgi:hypothetical protein